MVTFAVSEGLSAGKNRSAVGCEKLHQGRWSQENEKMLIGLKPHWHNGSFILKTVNSARKGRGERGPQS